MQGAAWGSCPMPVAVSAAGWLGFLLQATSDTLPWDVSLQTSEMPSPGCTAWSPKSSAFRQSR